MARSSYPTMQQVEHASLYQLTHWNRYLPGPGIWAIGEDSFEKVLDEEAEILNRIIERIKKLGGITPEVSKAVGWDRRSSMDRKMIASELLVVARQLLSIDFQTQDAMDKYLKDHPDADKSNHKVVKKSLSESHPFKPKDPKNPTDDEIDKHNKELSDAIQLNQKSTKKQDDKSVWDEMTPKQRSEAESRDRQDAKEKAKKNAASEMLRVARELLSIDFPTQDAMDKYLKDHPDANRSNHKVVQTTVDTKKDDLDDDLKGFSHAHGMSKSDGGKWIHPEKGDILKKVKDTIAEYEKAINGRGVYRDVKRVLKERLPELKKLLKKHGAE